MRVGENIAPNRMGVQYGAGSAKPHDREVQKCFSRSTSGAREHVTIAVDFQNVVGGESAFVDTARGDRQSQRLAVDDRAEVSACAEHPPARVKAATNLGQILCSPRNSF